MPDNPPGFAQQRLHSAVLDLATTEGTLQERLAQAYLDGISVIGIGDLPPGRSRTRDDLAMIQKEMATLETQDSGDQTAQGILALNYEQAHGLAAEIVELYESVIFESGKALHS